MDLALLIGGLGAGLAAVLLLMYFVFRPAHLEVPIERRRPAAAAPGPGGLVSRFSGAAVAAAERRLGSKGRGLFTRTALEGAGLKQSPAEYAVLAGAGTVVAVVLGALLQGPALAVIFGLLAPFAFWAFLQIAADHRRGRFDLQLPDTIMTLSGSLRAGHSIMRAIDGTSGESEAPMSEELARIVNETRVGRDLDDAMMEVAERMASEDFSWVAQAIQINREVGGDLAQVLDHVHETIQERAQIKGQVKALSAEGKFSAYILVALPFAISLLISVMNPGYLGVLFSHPVGLFMLGLGAVMIAIGSFWMSRMVKIKF